MNWACVMIEPSVRTLLIRLYYPDLSSRMRPGHHRSYVINNNPTSFEFQLALLSERELALFGWIVWTVDICLLLKISDGGESSDLVPCFFPRLKSRHQVTFRVPTYARQTLLTQPSPDRRCVTKSFYFFSRLRHRLGTARGETEGLSFFYRGRDSLHE